MTGINIGTAFLQLIPSFEGSRRASEQAGDDMGRRAGESFSDRFTRDVNGRLRDSQGRFVRAGEDIGQGMGSRAGEEFGDQFTRDAQGRLRDARGRFVREGEQLGQGMGEGMQRPLGQSGEQGGGNFLGGLKGKAMAGIAGIGLAVGAAFMDAYTEATDVRNSKAKLQANLGLEPDAAAALGKTAGQLYAQGYGESIGELTSTVGEVFSSIQGLDVMDSSTLEDLTGKALSFSQAFDTDVSESIQSVGTLMNSGLAKDAENAFDLITKASQSVPAALRGNVLEASDEYSQFFRTLGFSGDEAFGALVKGAEKGEFGIDKTGDAIKEFTLLSTDMSDNSVAAYESIGLNAQEMASSILAGGDTAKGAFDQIVDGILSIQDPVAQSQAALALFGTPLEDMNVQDIPEFLQGLKGMSGGMGDVEGAADDMDAAMGSTTSSVELFWRGLKTKLVDYISDEVLPRVTEFTAWLGEKLGPIIQVVGEWISTKLVPAVEKLATWLGEKLGPVVQKVADFFSEVLVPAAQKAWEWFEVNLLPTIERVGEFIGSTFENIVSILGGFIDLIAGVFTGDWSRAWEGVKEIFGGIWDQIKNIFSTLWDVMVEFFTNLGPKLWEIVTSLAGQLVQWGGQFLGWIWQGIQEAAPAVWDWFLSIPEVLWGYIQGAWSTVAGWGTSLMNWIWSGDASGEGTGGIKGAAVAVWDWFLHMPEMIWAWVTAKWQEVVQWGSNLISWIWQGTDGNGGIVGGAQSIIDWFAALPGVIWGAIQGAWSAATSWGAELVKHIISGIDGSSPYVSAALAKTLFDAAGSIGIDVAGLAGMLTGVNVNDTIDDYLGKLQRQAVTLSPGYQSGGRNAPGRATGGLFGPYDGHAGGMINVGTHGTADDVLIRGSKTEFMVNAEDTQKNLPLLMHINAGGSPWDMFPGFASGGLIGGVGQLMGAGLMKAILPQIVGALDSSVRNASSGGVVINGNLQVNGYTAPLPAGPRGEAMKAVASKMGTSYVWGAAGPDVFDCSGLISWALTQAGIGKGRLTAQGFNESFPHVGSPGKPGDLATFDTGRLPGQAGHIGMILDPARGLMMHTDGAGPARVGDYFSRDGGPLSIVDAIGGAADISAADRAAGAKGDPPAKGFLGSFVEKLAGGFASKFMSLGPSAPGGSGVERWRPMAMDALAAVGNYLGKPLTQFIDNMLLQIRTESSGDPNAINLWDINAMRGTPSVGLLQTIQPTFENALRGTPFANLIPKGPRDPWANMIASILYGDRRYGSLDRAYRGVAYLYGGMVPDLFGMGPGIDSVPAMLAPEESVLTPPETEAYQAHARALAAGFDSFEPKGGFTFTGDIHMGSGGPADFFDEALWRATVTH